MMALDFLTLGLAAIWGGVLGAIFFGGLWWTLRELPRWRLHYRRVFGLSFLVRALIALGGFWVALQHSVMAFGVTIATFALMRFILVRRLGKKGGRIRAS